MPIAIIIALLLAGGVSVGAQSATPGSLLYPVKTEVNERVEQALAFSAEGKANVHADLAGHRLTEMEKVANEPGVSAEVIADLKARFDEQAKLFNEIVAKLKADGNDTAAARVSAAFNNVIAQHEALIAKLSTEASTSVSLESRGTIEDLLHSLREQKSHNEKVKAESEDGAGDNEQVDESSTTENDNDGDSAGVEGEVHVQTGTSVNSEHATSGIQIDEEGSGRIGI